MIECTKCLGSGLIGSGENPHLREGHQRTCDLCGGTGKIAEGTVEAAAEAPVDNQPAAPAPKDGILKRIFG